MARHVVHQSALYALLHSPAGGVARDILRRGLKVETQAKRNLAGANGKPRRIDTGQTRASVTTTMLFPGGVPTARVGSPLRKAVWIHHGTGVYGPRRTPIRPKRGRLLRFKPKGSPRYIYVRSVKGMRPNPFLADALPAARD